MEGGPLGRSQGPLASLPHHPNPADARHDRHPHLQAVHVLPVVHLRKRLPGFLRNPSPQVQSQLPHVDEGVLVARLDVQAVQLHDAVPHESQVGEGVFVHELAALGVGQVH